MRRCSYAVISCEKRLYERSVIECRIEHYSRHDVALELLHISARTAVTSFLKDTSNSVGFQVTDVWTQVEVVGERRDERPKICDIIPDVRPLRDIGPLYHVLLKRRVGRVSQRLGEVAFDVAQSNDHIRPWLRDERCRSRPLVRQCVHSDGRVVVLDRVSNHIDCAEERATSRAFSSIDRQLLGALALLVIVVLADGNDGSVWGRVEVRLDLLHEILLQRYVRPAQLTVGRA